MTCPASQDWDLLAMGVIDGSPADEMRTHAEVCAACRTEFLAARRAHTERLRRYEAFDHQHDELRDSLMAALAPGSPAEADLRPRRVSRIGDWIMSLNTKTTRRVAAVLAPAACIAIGALIVLSPSHRSAFAAAIERMREARTIIAHFEAYLNQADVPMQSGTLYLSDEHGMRFDAVGNADAAPGFPNVMGMSMFHQPGGPVILLQPALKFGLRMHTPDGQMRGWSGNWDQSSPDQFLAGFRKMTGEADARLGHSVIDGRAVEGFEVSARKLGLEFVGSTTAGNHPARARLWVDSESYLPVRMEIEITTEVPVMGDMSIRVVYNAFEFDRPLAAADFEPTIPDDLRMFDIKVPGPSEETLIDALRQFAEATGNYPVSLDPSRMVAQMMVALVRNGDVKMTDDDPASAITSGVMERAMQVTMGAAFVQQLAREGHEPEYFGTSVSPEDASEVLLRWRLADGGIRVIFGDLHVETQAAK
ncbi:MAG: hypothetical protein U1D55_07120 [Phycisphaerae bacterium]